MKSMETSLTRSFFNPMPKIQIENLFLERLKEMNELLQEENNKLENDIN